MKENTVKKEDKAGYRSIFFFLPVCFQLSNFHSALICLGFYAVSTVFQLFNSDRSQIYVSWTIFNQYLTSPLSRHRLASYSAIPIILTARGQSHYYQVLRIWPVLAGDWTHDLELTRWMF